MALADSITALGTAILNLVGTRLNRDANNFSTAGTQNLNNMIDSRIGAVTGAPVGTVIAYMGTDEPEGFLLMDGRELSRTTYAALFAVIGTSQGAGNGSTTFNIADMTDGRYLMGSTVAGTSVSQEVPLKSYGLGIRNTKSNGNNGNAWFNPSNCTTSNIEWKEAAALMSYTGENNHFVSYATWQYGDGTLVRPKSNSCKFFIRYM